MKTIWIVTTGADFEDCTEIHGCFTLESSARKKIEELCKTSHPTGKFEANLYRKDEWCYKQYYIRLLEEDLHEE